MKHATIILILIELASLAQAQNRNRTSISIVLFLVFACSSLSADRKRTFVSHPPMRPLPVASSRPLTDGPRFFVDAKRGNDKNDGSESSAWKTLSHAVNRLKPGDTLCLRGGTYYENVTITAHGKESKPITIRGFPNELAIIDGGLREFFESPKTAWEPHNDGAEGEFRTPKKFPNLERVMGNFGDSMVPLHGYRFAHDFRATNQFSIRKDGEQLPIYLGPGVWYDAESQRIHARLSHTHVRAYEPGAYRGETDPRKLPMVVAGLASRPLFLEKAQHIRVKDLVIRGGGDHSVLLSGCNHIQFDNVTCFSGNDGIIVETTGHLKITGCTFRGPMPPWGSRSASKYRTFDSHLFVPVGTADVHIGKRKYYSPQCHDFEIVHCEFTDGHDGPYVGGVKRFRFHHNLVDNMNDDGIYISAWGPPGTGLQVDQNWFSRCLTTFAFGLGRGSESDPSDGVTICRNVIDLRGPVPYGHPGPDNPPTITTAGRISGDHGGPIWDPMRIYHNTFIIKSPQMYGYPFGWGGHMHKTSRRVFNNIFVQTELQTVARPPSAELDYQTDGNLIWSMKPTGDPTTYFDAFRKSPQFAASKKQYAPGWEAHSQFADPKFKHLNADWRQPADVWLQPASPAIDSGIELPKDWPDPLRHQDKGRPDIGALPDGVHFQVGLPSARAADPK